MFFNRKPFIQITINGGKSERRTIDGDVFVIGSGQASDLQLASPLIAERHLVLRRQDKSWIARVEGLNPVEINGERLLERDRTIRSGDRINIAGLVTLLFKDPAETVVEEKKPDAAGAQPENERISPVLFAAFGLVMVGSTIAAIFLLSRPAPQRVDMTRISMPSIQRAVATLPDCIDDAARRIAEVREARKSDTVREFDLESTFWSIAARAAVPNGAAPPEELARLQEKARQWLFDGLQAERRTDYVAATRAYQTLQKLVPDIGCDAHLLAARRIQAIK